MPEKYYDPTTGEFVTPNQIKRLGKSRQAEIIKDWFHKHYDDPAVGTPYESAEGGYIYIWGGPYDAREEIEGEFYEFASKAAIESAVGDLEQTAFEWTGKPDYEGLDDILEELDALTINDEPYEIFSRTVREVTALVSPKMDPSANQTLLRLVFVGIIFALEGYLGHVFYKKISDNNRLMRKFIETTPHFKEKKFTGDQIFSLHDNVSNLAKEFMEKMIWHRIDIAKNLYRDTLGINFPKDISEVMKAIIIRHDIVHRNGITKQGDAVILTLENVQALEKAVTSLVNYIDEQAFPLPF